MTLMVAQPAFPHSIWLPVTTSLHTAPSQYWHSGLVGEIAPRTLLGFAISSRAPPLKNELTTVVPRNPDSFKLALSK